MTLDASWAGVARLSVLQGTYFVSRSFSPSIVLRPLRGSLLLLVLLLLLWLLPCGAALCRFADVSLIFITVNCFRY